MFSGGGIFCSSPSEKPSGSREGSTGSWYFLIFLCQLLPQAHSSKQGGVRPEDALVSSLSVLACTRPGDLPPRCHSYFYPPTTSLCRVCRARPRSLVDFRAFLLLSLVALIFKPHQFVATAVVFQDGEKASAVSAAARKGSPAGFVIFRGDALIANAGDKRRPLPLPPYPSEKLWFPRSSSPPESPWLYRSSAVANPRAPPAP